MWRPDRTPALRARPLVSGLALSWLLLVVLALPSSARAQSAAAGPNQCATCHAGLADTVAAREVAADVHGSRGFTCADCHGGDPAATDRAAAHDPKKGYVAVPAGSAVVTTCARCHADAGLMRSFAPAQRIDQAAEYATSVHGQRLAAGDAKVATCVSCHGAHGVRKVSDAKSPVYPLNVATTCAKCHADPAHMSGYQRGGSPLPTTQFEAYKGSVHFKALTEKQDLSAPTCNDCHGNHGAAPPGAGAVVNVCGTCHAVFAEKFATSVHRDVFERGCIECHDNHRIAEPTDAMLGAGPEALCSTCHADDDGAKAATAMHAQIESLRTAVDRADTLLTQVKQAGLEVGEHDLKLREARNHLVLTRTEIHGFKPDAVAKVAEEGLALTRTVEEAAQAGERELRFRRQGLAVSMVAILVVVAALILKIRSLEKRPPAA
jgi:predicted CXXCH cytochrome family protein